MSNKDKGKDVDGLGRDLFEGADEAHEAYLARVLEQQQLDPHPLGVKRKKGNVTYVKFTK